MEHLENIVKHNMENCGEVKYCRLVVTIYSNEISQEETKKKVTKTIPINRAIYIFQNTVG